MHELGLNFPTLTGRRRSSLSGRRMVCRDDTHLSSSNSWIGQKRSTTMTKLEYTLRHKRPAPTARLL